MSDKVKFYHSGMAGAPQLSGTSGAMLPILQACLVDGFGATGVTGIEVVSEVATVTVPLGHVFEIDTVALIAGVTDLTGLNGEQKVLSADTTHFTFAAPGVADGVAAGTMTAKLAPSGWTLAFAGTNKAAYKTSATYGEFYLRVDDGGAEPRAARVCGYEAMTDIDTGTIKFPTTAQVSDGLYWSKSSVADSSARGWFVCADDAALILGLQINTGTGVRTTCFFGAINSYLAGDSHGAAIIAPGTYLNYPYGTQVGELPLSGGSGGVYLARSHDAVNESVAAFASVGCGRTVRTSGGQTYYPQHPSPIDGAVRVASLEVIEGATELFPPRGYVPGHFHSLIYAPAMNLYDRIEADGDLAGRHLLVVKTNNGGTCFVDLTGPWR